jgi:hypothetical protein
MCNKKPKHKWLKVISGSARELAYQINERFDLDWEDETSIKHRIFWPVVCFLHDSVALPIDGLYSTINGTYWNFDADRPFTIREYLALFLWHRPARAMKEFMIYTIFRRERVDEHLGCPSWPDCDEAPMGCIIERGLENVEWYGARD